MSVFDEAAATLFADPNLAVDGFFTAPPAAAVAVRIIFARRDEAVELGFPVEVRAPGWAAWISKALITTRPRVDVDYVTAAVVDYRIRDVAEDVERTAWALDVIEL